MHISLGFVIFGLSIAILGIFLWIISFINIGASFGVLPRKQKRVTRGIYKYARHPMYIGIWCTFIGLSLTNESWAGLFFTLVVITPLLFIRARIEDKNLVD